MNTDQPSTDDLETAYSAALNPYFDIDCITTTFDSHKGEFVIEFGNFHDGLVFNVAGFSSEHSPTDFKSATTLEVADEGDYFCVFRPTAESAGELVAETLEIASGINAKPTDINPRNIENLPSWWPDSLKPWRSSGKGATHS